MRTRLAVLLTVLVLGTFAFALEPFTLGPVYKLGTATVATLPASSATITGGLIYVTDDGGVHVNTGTAWVPLVQGSVSDGYWTDAGAGFMQPLNTSYIRNDDAGYYPPLYFVAGTPGTNTYSEAVAVTENRGLGDAWGFLGFRTALTLNSTATLWGGIWGSQTNSGSTFNGMNYFTTAYHTWTSGSYPSGAGTVMMQLTPTKNTTSRYWESTAGSGSPGFSTFTAGARWKFTDKDNGVSDYFVGDGTGIETPVYVESSDYVQGATGLCTGTACAGTAFASFPAAAGLTGRARYDSTSSVWRTSDGTAWHPAASGFSFSGHAGTGVTPLNNTATLGVSYSSAPSVVSRLSCLWGGGTGGTTGVVVELSPAGAASTGFCSCALGACNSTTPSNCACLASIPAGSQVIMQYRTTLLDGGAGADCATNPTEIICNTN